MKKLSWLVAAIVTACVYCSYGQGLNPVVPSTSVDLTGTTSGGGTGILTNFADIHATVLHGDGSKLTGISAAGGDVFTTSNNTLSANNSLLGPTNRIGAVTSYNIASSFNFQSASVEAWALTNSVGTNGCLAVGRGNSVTGIGSIGLGQNNTASSLGVLAIGENCFVSSGTGQLVVGGNIANTGKYSIAFGNGPYTSGTASFVGGATTNGGMINASFATGHSTFNYFTANSCRNSGNGNLFMVLSDSADTNTSHYVFSVRAKNGVILKDSVQIGSGSAFNNILSTTISTNFGTVNAGTVSVIAVPLSGAKASDAVALRLPIEFPQSSASNLIMQALCTNNVLILRAINNTAVNVDASANGTYGATVISY